MIEVDLNRFLTSEEIRETYKVPTALFAKLVPSIPWHYEDEMGVRYYVEDRVDSFFHEWAVRCENTKARPGASQAPDGPRPPDCFCLHGKVCKNIPRKAWLLLKTLWEAGAGQRVERDEVMEAVYEVNYDQTVDAIDSLRKRLNKVLAEQGCPAEVMNRRHYLWLDTYTLPAK